MVSCVVTSGYESAESSLACLATGLVRELAFQ